MYVDWLSQLQVVEMLIFQRKCSSLMKLTSRYPGMVMNKIAPLGVRKILTRYTLTLLAQKVTVWSVFWSEGVIGPYFFENNKDQTETVNG